MNDSIYKYTTTDVSIKNIDENDDTNERLKKPNQKRRKKFSFF